MILFHDGTNGVLARIHSHEYFLLRIEFCKYRSVNDRLFEILKGAIGCVWPIEWHYFLLIPREASHFRNNCGLIYRSSPRDQGMISVSSPWSEIPILRLLWYFSGSLLIFLHVVQSWDNQILGPQRCIWKSSRTACVFVVDLAQDLLDVGVHSYEMLYTSISSECSITEESA